jgi:hypothetical protein
MRARLPAALSLVLAWSAGCVYSPAGSCEVAADCAAGERCDGGVCVADAAPPGGMIPGADPDAVVTAPAWSALDAATGARFRVDSAGADLAGNVYVAGTVSGVFAPWGVGTGAFVARRAASGGALDWAVGFPTFSHGRLATAALPGGGVFFAATAFDPTTVGALSYTPPARGALVLGLLDPAGEPVWARAVPNTHPSAPLAPSAVAVTGTGDLLVAGTGSGDFGRGDTGGAAANPAFVAKLSGGDGSCLWSRGLGTRTLSDVEARDDGQVAIAGLCTPAGASFDPGGGTTCARGLFLAVLHGGDGSTDWARTSSGAGAVTAVRDLAIAPDRRATVVGDARGVVSFGGGAVDFGATDGSFAASLDASGAATGTVLRPVEAPYADALVLSRAAYDRAGRLWLAGRYVGEPALGGIRLSPCRAPGCGAAAFLARIDPAAAPELTSLVPILAAPVALGGAPEPAAAWVDDLALFATTGTVAHALHFTGTGAAPGPGWPGADGGLGVLRVLP